MPLKYSFCLKRMLGSGGFGVVAEALVQSIGLSVALKFVRLDGSTQRKSVLEEIRTLAFFGRHRHPNINYAHFVFEFQDGFLLGLEMVDGANHLGFNSGASLPLVQSLQGQLLAALEFMHRFGYVHHDLKPDNTIVERETGRLVLLDLGLAVRHFAELMSNGRSLESLLDDEVERRSRGTSAYMDARTFMRYMTRKEEDVKFKTTTFRQLIGLDSHAAMVMMFQVMTRAAFLFTFNLRNLLNFPPSPEVRSKLEPAWQAFSSLVEAQDLAETLGGRLLPNDSPPGPLIPGEILEMFPFYSEATFPLTLKDMHKLSRGYKSKRYFSGIIVMDSQSDKDEFVAAEGSFRGAENRSLLRLAERKAEIAKDGSGAVGRDQVNGLRVLKHAVASQQFLGDAALQKLIQRKLQ